MRISVVTPSLDRAAYLSKTIESVLSQEGDFEIDYVIQDGGSSGEVLHILDHWREEISSGRFRQRCKGISFRCFSEADRGMYDAISKGFSQTTGEIMSWINTDDMYHPYAFQTITQIFSKDRSIDWITGIPTSYNKDGSVSGMDTFPNAYSREFISRGYYDVKFLSYGFNWIQQESTFWRRSLWEKAGSRLDDSRKYTSDFYLWRKFAKHADLVKVYSFLGGYRVHDDQITADPSRYRSELDNDAPPPRGLFVAKTVLENLPFLRKVFFNRFRGAFILPLLGLKWEWLVGRSVRWSYEKKEWVTTIRGIMGDKT